MKIKTRKLEGITLDFAVATALGYEIETEGYYSYELEKAVVTKLHGAAVPGRYSVDTQWSPSSKWEHGAPIISKAHISRIIDHSGVWVAYWTSGYVEGDEGKLHMQCDSSELVAGLRCFVALELGDEVEIPEELL